MKPLTQEQIKHVLESIAITTLDTVGNQIKLSYKSNSIFKSYDTNIAANYSGAISIYPSWNYSATTNKYRSGYLGEGKQDTLYKLSILKYTYEGSI